MGIWVCLSGLIFWYGMVSFSRMGFAVGYLGFLTLDLHKSSGLVSCFFCFEPAGVWCNGAFNHRCDSDSSACG